MYDSYNNNNSWFIGNETTVSCWFQHSWQLDADTDRSCDSGSQSGMQSSYTVDMQKLCTRLCRTTILKATRWLIWSQWWRNTCEPQRSVLSQQSHGYPLLYPVQSLAVKLKFHWDQFPVTSSRTCWRRRQLPRNKLATSYDLRGTWRRRQTTLTCRDGLKVVSFLVTSS